MRCSGGKKKGGVGGRVNEVGSGGKGLIINKSDSFFLGGRVFQGVGNFMECRRWLNTMGSMYHYGTLIVTTIKNKSYQTNCSRAQDLMKKCRTGASL